MRILSGIQPSGAIHIGNYLGMVKPMVESQNRGDLFCFIADLHSLTSVFDGRALSNSIRNAFIDMLALGIDPEQSIFWVQSDVPEVTELTWYLNSITPVGLLQRCHSYKDKTDRGIPASNGLFSYPVLMAADILLYQSDIVPVGRDQKQHVEVTRDIAAKFNQQYENVFTLPVPEISGDVAVIPGIDGQKMSKSYGNTIEIFAPEKAFRKKLMSIVTDSTPVAEPKDPDNSVICALYRLFADETQSRELEQRFREGGMGYGDAKKALFEMLWEYFLPYRKRREQLAADPGHIRELRRTGEQRAREIALPTLNRVREAVGVRLP